MSEKRLDATFMIQYGNKVVDVEWVIKFIQYGNRVADVEWVIKLNKQGVSEKSIVKLLKLIIIGTVNLLIWVLFRKPSCIFYKCQKKFN